MVDYSTFQKRWDGTVGKEMATEFDRWKHTSRLTRDLQLTRIEKGLTEEDIAKKIPGWTVDDVLEFEMSEMQSIHISDLLHYLRAVQVEMSIRLREKGIPITEDVAFHTLKIGELLESLVKMSGDDPKITEETVEFLFSYHHQITSLIVHMIASFPRKEAVQSFMDKISASGLLPKTDEISFASEEMYLVKKEFG